MSQHEKIIKFSKDGEYHCQNEYRANFIYSPHKRREEIVKGGWLKFGYDYVFLRKPCEHGVKNQYDYRMVLAEEALKMVQLGDEKGEAPEAPKEKPPTEVHRQGGQDVTGLLPFNFPQRAVRALRQEVPSNAPLLPQKPVGDPPLRTP